LEKNMTLLPKSQWPKVKAFSHLRGQLKLGTVRAKAAFTPGARIKLQGLSMDTFNGQLATVGKNYWLDSQGNQKWPVTLDKPGLIDTKHNGVIEVKEANMQLLPTDTITRTKGNGLNTLETLSENELAQTSVHGDKDFVRPRSDCFSYPGGQKVTTSVHAEAKPFSGNGNAPPTAPERGQRPMIKVAHSLRSSGPPPEDEKCASAFDEEPTDTFRRTTIVGAQDLSTQPAQPEKTHLSSPVDPLTTKGFIATTAVKGQPSSPAPAASTPTAGTEPLLPGWEECQVDLEGQNRGWEEEQGTPYWHHKETNQCSMVKPTASFFEPGAIVQINGMNQQILNGQTGTIVNGPLSRQTTASRTTPAQCETLDTKTGKVTEGRWDVSLFDQKLAQHFGGNVGVKESKLTRLQRRLGSLEASDDLSVVQECLVGAFLLLLMFMVYLFTRRVTAPKAFDPNGTRIVRKKAPTFVRKLL